MNRKLWVRIFSYYCSILVAVLSNMLYSRWYKYIRQYIGVKTTINRNKKDVDIFLKNDNKDCSAREHVLL